MKGYNNSIIDILEKYRKFRSKFESLLIESNNKDLISDIDDFEKNLTESEKLFNETNKIAKIGGWKVNLKTSELKWTKEVYHIHEVSKDFVPTVEEAIGFYDEDSKEIVQKVFDVAVKFGKPFDEELAIITAKGNKINVRALGKIEKDENGTPEIIYGTFQDITKQKKAEEELLKTRLSAESKAQQLKLIANNLVDGMVYQVAMLDENKRHFNHLGDSVLKLYGCTPEEAMKNPDLIYGKIYPEDIDSLNAAEKKALKNMSIFKTEARVFNPDGSIRWSYYVSQPRIINNLVCWDGIEVDISERKLMELDLKAAKEKAEENEREIKAQQAEIQLHNQRLESLLRISQFKSNSIQELLDYALEEAIELTNSKIGYIYFYNESTRQFILNTWSKEVMKECTAQNPLTVYNLDDTGCWGEAVRQQKPIVMNQYNEENPIKKGTPEGHVKLNKFLTIPVILTIKKLL